MWVSLDLCSSSSRESILTPCIDPDLCFDRVPTNRYFLQRLPTVLTPLPSYCLGYPHSHSLSFDMAESDIKLRISFYLCLSVHCCPPIYPLIDYLNLNLLSTCAPKRYGYRSTSPTPGMVTTSMAMLVFIRYVQTSSWQGRQRVYEGIY